MRDTIDMAREAGPLISTPFDAWCERLVALVRADERAAPVQDSTCSNSLREQGKAYPRTCGKCGLGPCIALANAALDKKADNARELGLDYEPVLKDNSNYRLDTPVAKPVAWWIPKAEQFCMAKPDGARPFDKAWQPLYTTPPNVATPLAAQQDIQRLSALVRAQQITIDKLEAQRQWVGLTDDERVDLWKATETDNRMVLIDAIEAKLKEKNT